MNKIIYLDEFNYFRGVSIFLVVLEHMLILFGLYADCDQFKCCDKLYIYRSLAVVVWGGTALFVFISGFLFYYVFYQRGFKYIEFMKKKVKKIFFPYVFMMVNLIILKFISRYIIFYTPWNSIKDFINDTFFFWSFWYIPFIMLVFASSIIYLYFIKKKFKYKILILFISMIISMVVGRYNYSIMGPLSRPRSENLS